MTGPGSCVRLSWRAWLLVALLGGLVAGLALWLSLAGPAAAQTQLTLADFDDAGLETDALALIEAGHDVGSGSVTVYKAPPRAPVAGTLLDGELGLGSEDVPITWIRFTTSGDSMTINKSGTDFLLRDYFGTGGDGADLTLRVQTADASGAGTINTGALGGSYANFTMDADAQTLLTGLADGDRFIIALTRPVTVGAVSNLQETAATSSSITVSWDAADNAAGYKVQWRVTGSGDPLTEATTTATTHTITGLDPDTTHTVMVFGTLTGAADGAGATATVATTQLQPPAQVTGLRATAAARTSIDVAWDAAARADGYTVEWGTTSGSYTDDDTTASTSHAITGLSASTTYYLRVTATRTGADDGAPSAERSAATGPGTLSPPGPVVGLNLSVDDYDSITASWSPVADADGYVLEWDDDSAFGSSNEATISSGSTVTHRITGLQEDTTYYARVHATRTGAADGAVSDVATAATGLQPPGQATGVSATAASDVSIDVSWTPALRADAYRVEWGTTSGVYPYRAAATSTSHTITGLTFLTTYHVRVVATRTGASDGAPSSEDDATTEAAPTPAPVANLMLSVLSDRELQATWTAAANATGYVVQWDTDIAFSDPDEARTSGTGVIIERLRAETEYHVRVQGARAGATAGAYSTSASATTGDAPTRVWAERFPGGAIAAQLVLSAFGGVMAGVRFKSMKSPRREAVITGAMSLGALILPAFGLANEFWVIGVALLVLLASIAAIFLARR